MSATEDVPAPSQSATEQRERRPAILCVDDEPAVLAAVSRDLRRRYGEHYRIVRAGSGGEALELLGELRRVADVAGPITAPVMRWISASLSARQLAAELVASTDQMGQLVLAIKKYAYMDRGEVVEVDLTEGLDTTLTILKHKLKHTSIDVVRDYDSSLGKALVYAGELNQVWTNLLDNAIDALGESGTITITTRVDGDCAELDIADNGPGIPAEVKRRVFDPFFTTKDVGNGTGLGLDTARRIVVDRHHGSLTVSSSVASPTGTVFHVRIPVDAARR